MSKLLKVGDVIQLKLGHKIYADVPEHFVYSNKRGSFKLTHTNITIGGETSYFAGRYVVVKTKRDGGGTGHGPGDVYPDGHHVFCEAMDNPDLPIVDFYQTGSFTAMIENIEPIGTAEQKVIKKEWKVTPIKKVKS